MSLIQENLDSVRR